MNNKTVYVLKNAQGDRDSYFYYMNTNSVSFTDDFDSAIKFHNEECARLMREELAYLGKQCNIIVRIETYTELE